MPCRACKAWGKASHFMCAQTTASIFRSEDCAQHYQEMHSNIRLCPSDDLYRLRGRRLARFSCEPFGRLGFAMHTPIWGFGVQILSGGSIRALGSMSSASLECRNLYSTASHDVFVRPELKTARDHTCLRGVEVDSCEPWRKTHITSKLPRNGCIEQTRHR